jgi:hypothetical protein
MSELCTWIVFNAHPTKFTKKEDEHPDFFGIFVCPVSRRDPEELLGEILGNRKLFLTRINEHKSVKKSADWGMNERLKSQVDEHGFGVSLTKVHQGLIPPD